MPREFHRLIVATCGTAVPQRGLDWAFVNRKTGILRTRHGGDITMKTTARIAACAAITAVMLAPTMAPASRVVTLATGTMVSATMNQTLDSGSAQVGQHFTMTVVA